MDYQNLSYFLFVVCFFLLVTMILFMSNSFLGNWYKEKFYKVTFVMSILILIFSLLRTYSFFVLSLDYFYNGAFTIGVNFYLSFFDVLFIYMGFFRYFSFIKNGYKLSHIILKESDYVIHHDTKFRKMYTGVAAKVEHYAVTNLGDTILFLAGSPTKASNIDCICYKVNNGIYHCTSYHELNPKISFGFIFHKMLTLFLIVNAYIFPVLLVYADMNKFYLEQGQHNYVLSPMLCLLGGMCIKLFYKTNTYFKYFMYVVAVMFLSVGIMHYLDFLK